MSLYQKNIERWEGSSVAWRYTIGETWQVRVALAKVTDLPLTHDSATTVLLPRRLNLRSPFCTFLPSYQQTWFRWR